MTASRAVLTLLLAFPGTTVVSAPAGMREEVVALARLGVLDVGTEGSEVEG